MNMKAAKLAILTAIMTLAVARSYADQTNLVQNLSIQLLGVAQGRSVTNGSYVMSTANWVSVDTRRVIAALGAATLNTFSPTSRLAVITPLEGGFSSIQVRDGNLQVDVTGFFAQEQLSDTIRSAYFNRRPPRAVTVDYSIQRLTLQDSEGSAPLTLHFDVRGFAVETSSNRGPGSELNVNASGAGDRNGNLLILQGSITVRGGTLEVIPGGGYQPS
jgi:hypothetical protein